MAHVDGRAGESWGDDTVYCEATCAPEDILYEGSEDEDYESPDSRRKRYESAGQKFLDGQIPLLLSATLKGPFDQASGWTNPWRSRYRTLASSRRSLELPGKPTPEQHDSVIKSAAAQDSLECHLPSPESIKHVSVGEMPHPFLEDDELAMVQRWRKSVQPVSMEEFWATTPQGTKSERKRKAVGSEWLRRLANKRRRADIMESGSRSVQHTPVPKLIATTSLPGDDGTNSSFNSSTPDLISATNARDGYVVANSQPLLEDNDKQLDGLHKISFISAPGLLQPSGGGGGGVGRNSLLSPRGDSKGRAAHWLRTSSKGKLSRDEIVAMKAAATLSSPVSQQRCSSALSPNLPRHGMSQQTDRHSIHVFPSSNLDAIVVDHHDVDRDIVFETQQDDSFCFRMRSKTEEVGSRGGECDIAETASWAGLSARGAASTPERPVGSLELTSPEIEPSVTDKSIDDAPPPVSLGDESSDVEMALNPDVQSESNDHPPERNNNTGQVALEDLQSSIEVAKEASTSRDTGFSIAKTNAGPELEQLLSDQMATAEQPLSGGGVAKNHNTDSGSETHSRDDDAEHDPTSNNDAPSEPETEPTGKTGDAPSQSRLPSPQDDIARESDSDSESSTCSSADNLPPQAEPKTSVPATPIKTPTAEGMQLSLLKKSVKKLLVPQSCRKTTPNLSVACQAKSSPVRKTTKRDDVSPGAFQPRLHSTPDSLAAQGALKVMDHITHQQSTTISSASPNNSIVLFPDPAMAVMVQSLGATTEQAEESTPSVSVSQQSPWASSKLSQYASIALTQLSLVETVETPQKKMDESDMVALSEAQTPWVKEHTMSAAPQNSNSYNNSNNNYNSDHNDHAVHNSQLQRPPLRQLQNNDGVHVPTSTVTVRPSTPEPQFSFKSFASFMSPSPERLPKKRAAWQEGPRLPSTQVIVASATENPWHSSASQRHVSWAPLPHEKSSSASCGGGNSSPAAAAPSQLQGLPRQRAVSPPPATPITQLPISEDVKFHHHFTAIAQRSGNNALRSRILPTASQHSLASPAPQAMAEAFLAADQLLCQPSSYEMPASQHKARTDRPSMCLPESREPIDVVEDVMREMGDFLGTWDVDTELDLARNGGGMQMSQLTQSPW
ncbi:hypothetical protein BGZ63DRAFT_395728 [Mariannaea sp. PMI_226]|nr:hypothetical protein BGZ63DRAFT_395728 [Mariannaea sp. PMI_226]